MVGREDHGWFPRKASGEFQGTVHCFEDSLEIEIKVTLPTGWNANKKEFQLSFDRRHEEQIIEFEVWPEEGAAEGVIEFECGQECGNLSRWQEISYDFLNEKYDEMTNKKYDLSKLKISYWKSRIKEMLSE